MINIMVTFTFFFLFLVCTEEIRIVRKQVPFFFFFFVTLDSF